MRRYRPCVGEFCVAYARRRRLEFNSSLLSGRRRAKRTARERQPVLLCVRGCVNVKETLDSCVTKFASMKSCFRAPTTESELATEICAAWADGCDDDYRQKRSPTAWCRWRKRKTMLLCIVYATTRHSSQEKQHLRKHSSGKNGPRLLKNSYRASQTDFWISHHFARLSARFLMNFWKNPILKWEL